MNGAPAAVAARVLEPDELGRDAAIAELLELSAADLLRAGAERGGSLAVAGESDTEMAAMVETAEARARGLLANGFEPGERLLVWLPSGLDLVLWSWAAVFAGGSALAVSTRSPAHEARRFMEMAEARTAIGSAEGEGFLTPEQAARTLRGGGAVELPAPSPEDDAACFTTSGSTGSSKLAVMSHRGFVAQLAAYQQVIGGGPGETVLHPLPLAHVASVAQVYLMLAQGRRVLTMPEYDAVAVVELAKSEAAAFLGGTPAMWGLTLSRVSLPDPELRLRRALYAAAPMPAAWAEGLKDALGCELVHAYGLTEAGTLTVLPPEKVLVKAGSAGGCVAPRSELAILDPESGEQLGPGRVGEICVRGPVTSPGYVGMPEETAELLAGGWLHTGDLGRLDEEGDLWVTGRIKDQINRGGLKIGAREVEEAIEELEGVVAAGVVGVADPVLGERVAAVVETEDPDLDAEAIRDAVADRLADYKVPHRIVCVEELPRNAMKKVDKPAIRGLLGDEA